MLPITRASRALQRPLVVARVRHDFQLLPRSSCFGTGINNHAQRTQSGVVTADAPPPLGEGAGAVQDVMVVGAGVGGTLAATRCGSRPCSIHVHCTEGMHIPVVHFFLKLSQAPAPPECSSITLDCTHEGWV